MVFRAPVYIHTRLFPPPFPLVFTVNVLRMLMVYKIDLGERLSLYGVMGVVYPNSGEVSAVRVLKLSRVSNGSDD